MIHLSKMSPQKKHRFSVFTILILCSFSFFNAEAQQVRELNTYLDSENLSSSDPFMDLLYGSGGIVEVKDGSLVLPRNPSPKNILLNSLGLSALSREEAVFGGIEFMQINLEEGGSFSLNYSSLAAFDSLKYIFVTSSSALTSDQVSQMLTGFAQSDILIFYQISRPG